MKSLLLALTAILLSVLFVISCDKERVETVETEITQETVAGFRADDKEKHIFYIAWDPGRQRHGCEGFGMCNVEACGFCCTLHGEIVPCDNNNSNNQSMSSVGTVEIDAAMGIGILTYKLNPNIYIENTAINNRGVFYIDNDIIMDDIIILAGNYQYDLNVGNYGGYTIDVIEN